MKAHSTRHASLLPRVMRSGIVLVVLLAAGACNDSHAPMRVAADDAEMNQAIDRARSEVATFVGRLEKPQPGDRDFAVKAPVNEGDEAEHFWLQNVRHEDGHFEGTIGNEPQLVRNVKFGDSVRVPVAGISDWMFVENDRLVGGYTIRVMLQRLSPDERRAKVSGLDFRIE